MKRTIPLETADLLSSLICSWQLTAPLLHTLKQVADSRQLLDSEAVVNHSQGRSACLAPERAAENGPFLRHALNGQSDRCLTSETQHLQSAGMSQNRPPWWKVRAAFLFIDQSSPLYPFTFTFHPKFWVNFFIIISAHRPLWGLEPLPAKVGQEARSTLDRSPP